MFSPDQTPAGIAATLLGSSGATDKVRHETQLAAGVGARVMLAGEHGVGKRRIAQLIHRQSPRCHGPFITIRCTDTRGSDLDTRLFGDGSIVRGGLMRAHGGTLFLEDLDQLVPELQTRLMDVLANERPKVRVISATTTPLIDKVNTSDFRSDLYYLLNQIFIYVLPLRDRAEDVEPLLEFFTAYYARRRGVEPPKLSDESRLACRVYRWPGNLRQLQTAAAMFVSSPREEAGSVIGTFLRQTESVRS